MRSWVDRLVSLACASLPATLLAMIAAAAPAVAQPPDAAVTWDVPCGEEAAFVAGVSDLGASFDGFEVLVAVAQTELGSFRGRLSVRRSGEPLVERELEDDLCHDVLDALVIAAALALRSLPRAPVVAPAEVVTVTPAVVAEEAPGVVAEEAPIAGAPASAEARFALGASLRVGLGPAPGLALAPTVAMAVDVDRVVAALHLAYWAESGATLADGARGVTLWALTSSLELGYRIGDAISVAPSIVLEPSVAFARGVGVATPRSEAAFVLDAGAAISLFFDLDRVRLFVRADALFGLVRPVYGVDGEAVFAGPEVRGTGSAGVLFFF